MPTLTTTRISRPAVRRARRRPRQKRPNIRAASPRRGQYKRGIHDQRPDDVQGCLDLCIDQGTHFDRDINTGRTIRTRGNSLLPYCS